MGPSPADADDRGNDRTRVRAAQPPRRGQGIFADRAGRATAAEGLRTPFALTLRLQRGSLIAWTAGMAIAGVAFGSVAMGIGDLIKDNPQMLAVLARMGGSAVLIDAFLAQILGMFGMITAFYGIQSTLRLRAEETAVRVEPLLATRVSRIGLALSHLAFGMLGTGVVLVAAGTGVGLAHGLRVDDVGGYVGSMLSGALAQLPAIWVVVGIATALFGLLPRFTTTAWAIAAAFVLLALFGPIFDLNPFVLDASPFTHVPRVPASDVTVAPLLALAAIAATLLVAGLAGFRRRDVG